MHIKRWFQTTKNMKPKNPDIGKNGFTLVVTLSLMILITVIAIGMLSLASISLRSSQLSLAESVAKANARLALQIAIGELQKTAGPDRRVTATAAIRKTAHSDKAHWTGVWSTENWKVKSPTGRTFVSWLATDPSLLGGPALENQVDAELGSGDAMSHRVEMVGAGTLGSSDPQGRVEVLTIPVRSSGSMPGSYAYWVGDEGVKARYDLADTSKVDDFTLNSRWAAAAKSGIQKISGMEAYSGIENSVLKKTLSFGSIKLAQATPLPPNLFHDLTTDSLGLPVDVRLGGARQDLSLAFELPLAEFNALAPFHLEQETNQTAWYDQLNAETYNRPEFYPSSHKLGYLFQIPADNYGTNRLRGPTWDLLRNHYRLYKREWEDLSWPRKMAASADALEARGSLPLSYACTQGGGVIADRFTQFSNETMYFAKSMKGPYSNESKFRQRPLGTFVPSVDALRRTAGKITPLVCRVTFVYGLVNGTFPYAGEMQETIGVSMDPYITIFNPYNQPIEFHSFGFHSQKFNPFSFRLEYTDKDGNSKTTEYNSSINLTNQGSLSFRLNPSTTGGKMRLAPGELRVISPEEIATGVKLDRRGATGLSGTGLYNETSGIVIPPDGAPVVPKSGTSVTLTVLGRAASGWQEIDLLNFSMFYPKLHRGEPRNVVTDLPPVDLTSYLDTDSIDDPQVLGMGVSTFPINGQRLTVKRSVGTSQIPRTGEAGQYVAAFDIWMKDFKTGNLPVLAQFNPRASVLDPRDYDGSNRISPGWDANLLSITDISVLNLVTASGQGRWGGGISGGQTTSHLCLYDIPVVPLTSLAQLQHADIGALATDAPNAIGNSFAPPAIPLASVFGQLKLATQNHTSWGPQTQGDFCWAANEMIWDRFFFSGLNWGDRKNRYPSLTEAVKAMGDPSMESPFLNSRVMLASRPADQSRLTKHDTIGDYLFVRGAFNINSTSQNAWKAVLSGLDGTELAYLLNGVSKTGTFSSPVSRFSKPAGDDSDRFRGFRALTDQQLNDLAREIVVQVKQRGPFMGLADFVNRRLENSDNGKLGALQAAIDAAGLNSSLPGNPTAGNVTNRLQSTQAGLPGYVTQADLLTSIGSFISARSDTFKVRAYGEATDMNGKVIARAWCEAIVQRTPDWAQASDIPATVFDNRYPAQLDADEPLFRPFVSNPSMLTENRTFGRKFQVMQFRWLSDREV